MCPYHVRPASTHCTNKSCLNEHDVMKSGHNRSIIDARDLLFLSGATLTEIIRASANPTRSVSDKARSIVPDGSWLVRFSFGCVTNTERNRVVPEDRSVIAYTTVTSLWSTLVRSRIVPMRSVNLVWPIFDRRRSLITTTKIFFKHSEKFFSNGQCDLLFSVERRHRRSISLASRIISHEEMSLNIRLHHRWGNEHRLMRINKRKWTNG